MADVFDVLSEKLSEVVCFGKETLSDVEDFIPTGCYVLDKIIGGGIPEKRITEIFGDESTGKSTLGLSILRQAQLKADYYVPVLIDTETSYDTNRAVQLGLDTNRLLYSDLDTIEDVFDLMTKVAKEAKKANKKARTVIVWDSLAATTTKAELEGVVGDSQYGLHARLLSQGFRMYRRIISEYDVTLIVLNQTRQNIQTFGYGPHYTTFGGKALKFYSSVRIRLRVVEKVKQGDNINAVKVEAETVKNKIYAPFKKVRFYIDFNEGIDNISSTLDYAIQEGFVEKKGGWYEYKGKKYRGVELVNYFKENVDELYNLIGGVNEEYKEQKIEQRSRR